MTHGDDDQTLYIARNEPKAPLPTATPTFAALKNSVKRIQYEELFQYSERYEGQTFYFKGEIVQVMEGLWNDKYDFRVDTDNDWAEDEVIYLAGHEGERLLEEDTIEFIGKSVGLKTYSAILRNSVTIPDMKVVQINRIIPDS